MKECIRYDELSKADQGRLAILCKGLGVPLFPFKTKSSVLKILAPTQQFFNAEAICSYKGGLAFHAEVDVLELMHDIAHALMLGPVWANIPDGIADLGDPRWDGREEVGCMFLQVAMGQCLNAYKARGGLRVAREMEQKGYGFGAVDAKPETTLHWFRVSRRGADVKRIQKLPVYRNFMTRDLHWNRKIVSKLA